MKTLLTIFAFFAFAFSASAQTTLEDRDNTDDKMQQEPPREPQAAVENAARQADVNAQNNKAQNESEDLVKKEKERSTGKEEKNPAQTNTTVTPPPAQMSEPVSKPSKRRN